MAKLCNATNFMLYMLIESIDLILLKLTGGYRRFEYLNDYCIAQAVVIENFGGVFPK